MFECLRRYLQSRGVLWPVVVCTVLSSAVTISLTYVLLFVYRMGIEGTAVSWVAAQWTSMMGCVACMLAREAWGRWRRRSHTTDENMSPISRAQEHGQANKDPLRVLPSAAVPSSSPVPSPSPSPCDSPTPLLLHDTAAEVQSSSPATSSHLLQPTTAAQLAMPDPSSEAATWPSPFDRAVLRHWGPLLRLALPGALSVMMELGAFQGTSVVAARFSRNCLATHSIFMQTTALLYVVPMGFSTGAAIAVGQMIGAARGERAWQVVQWSYFVHVAFPLVSGGILVLFLRHSWPALFSSEEGVLAKAASTMPILVFYLFADHIRCIGKSVLRSCGRSAATAYGHIFSCWAIGLPLIYLFCFPLHMGLLGLWLGMSLAWISAALIFLVVLLRTDWDVMVHKARKSALKGQHIKH